MAGLNFSNEDEARRFKEAIDKKLAMRRMRLEGNQLDPTLLTN